MTEWEVSTGIDYKLVFDCMPGMCLVLDPAFTILAQNIDHALATLSIAQNVIGMNLFEAFPDRDDSGASGIAAVRKSLITVLKTCKPDVMPIIRYDVRGARGPFEARYWKITNHPLLDSNGYVRWILNRAEDVTELVALRTAYENRGGQQGAGDAGAVHSPGQGD